MNPTIDGAGSFHSSPPGGRPGRPAAETATQLATPPDRRIPGSP